MQNTAAMRVEITPSRPRGTVTAQPSKSAAHRALIIAALAEGESRLCGICDSADMTATVGCLRELGADITISDGTATVRGVSPAARGATQNSPPRLNCLESGSTLRFLLPASLLFGGAVLCGTARLMERGVGIYRDLFTTRGIEFTENAESVEVRGRLTAGDFSLPGDVSSQFISGLLMALPLLPPSRDNNVSRIILTTSAESRSYIDMTCHSLCAAGAEIGRRGNEFSIPCGQRYLPLQTAIEGDWSQAAFFFALGDGINVTGLAPDSLQGDRAILPLLADLRRGYTKADLSNIPDLAPVLFTVAVMERHGAHFSGTRRLAIKESRRADAMAEELSKFGAIIKVSPDSVDIFPAPLHSPGAPLSSHGDHRIAMALAVAATRYGGIIEGAEAVAKSYPDFFEDLSAVGGNVLLHTEACDDA